MVRDEKLNSVFLIGGYDECGRTKSTEKVHINENWFCESTSDLFEPFDDYATTASKTSELFKRIYWIRRWRTDKQ